eukprot:33027-Eustigmatos_ZCMA.PRE.1
MLKQPHEPTRKLDPPPLLRLPQVGVAVAFDYSMRVLGPCLIVLCLGLITTVSYMYFRVLLPVILQTPRVTIGYALHSAWALALLFNVLFNYLYCVVTNPGNPRPEARVVNGNVEQGVGGTSSAIDP